MQSHYSVDQFGSEQLKLEIAHVKPVSLALQPCLFENRDGLVYNLCRAPAGVAGWRQRGRKKGEGQPLGRGMHEGDGGSV